MAARTESAMLAASLWAATARPRPVWPTLGGALRAEVAIVGAGYTGLAAALHLAERGRDVVVLEAETVGFGASGRNGGQVVTGLERDPDDLAARFGAERGRRFASFAAHAPDLVFGLVQRHAIACDAVRAGWLQPAHDPASLERQASRVRQWQALGVPMALLDAPAMRAKLGGTTCVGGIVDHRSGHLHPLDYVTGLARVAATQGARIFTGSRVIALERTGDGWRLTTPAGTLSAAQVLLAQNASADALLPGLRRSIVPIVAVQIATDPLPRALAAAILPAGHAAADTRRLPIHFRQDAAGRFVIGGRGAAPGAPLRRAVRRLEHVARHLFPALEGVAFPYRWGGLVALTADHLPHLHAPAPGLTAALGYNGRGVAMATAMGVAVAELLAGPFEAEPPVPVTRLAPVPFRAWRSLGGATSGTRPRLRDRR